MHKSSLGVFGLGVMGSSLALNMAEKGISLSVYNRIVAEEEHLVSGFLEKIKPPHKVRGCTQIQDFVASLERPRKIFLMIKAGEAVDAVLKELCPLLSKGDVVIDGGNAHYNDTNRRCKELSEKGIHLIGCGVSGGEEGARKGPSLMPGGSQEGYKVVQPILELMASKDKKNQACCSYLGEAGAGHFVKMVHNGIEYAEMQLLAELYALLSKTKTNEQIVQIFSNWNQGEDSSYLLEITIQILQAKENGIYIIDSILDKAGNKGTGSWSTQSALEMGTVNNMMSSAVFVRYLSSFKKERVQLAKCIKTKETASEISEETLQQAYRFARLINHHQGFELMRKVSEEFNWKLNLSEVARIWTNGCIIRSAFMETFATSLKTHENCLEHEEMRNQLINSEWAIVESIQTALKNRIGFDTFWSAYHYWISMTTETLPVNLIQAQRDYFGAHTYQKVGFSEDQFFHTNWNSL